MSTCSCLESLNILYVAYTYTSFRTFHDLLSAPAVSSGPTATDDPRCVPTFNVIRGRSLRSTGQQVSFTSRSTHSNMIKYNQMCIWSSIPYSAENGYSNLLGESHKERTRSVQKLEIISCSISTSPPSPRDRPDAIVPHDPTVRASVPAMRPWARPKVRSLISVITQ